MTQSASPQTVRSVAWSQTWLCAAVLLCVVVPHLISQIAVNNDWILRPHRLARWKAVNGLYANNGFYDDWDSSMSTLYDVLPTADYSHGGVYFTGASDISLGLALWELPPEEQALIHNYAFAASTHTQEFQFIRYLVEKRGLLEAGGDRTMIVLGLTMGSGAYADTVAKDSLWNYRLTRSGLFTYDQQTGMADASIAGLARRLRNAEFHDGVFWWWLESVVLGRDTHDVALPKSNPGVGWQTEWTNIFGPNWEPGMDLEIGQLVQTIDYLAARKVRVVGVLPPKGSWFNNFPPAVRYRRGVTAVFRSRGVPLLDLTHAVPDSRFTDSAHLNYVGVHETQPQLIHMAEHFLRQTGALPEAPASGK